jgi:hypothetical protein
MSFQYFFNISTDLESSRRDLSIAVEFLERKFGKVFLCLIFSYTFGLGILFLNTEQTMFLAIFFTFLDGFENFSPRPVQNRREK